ncbi:hypothetical protein EUTSA_v10015574mg, partial [Eutrema salsugineum]
KAVRTLVILEIASRRALGVTTVYELQSLTLPNCHILNVIDTPGLFSLSPSTEFTCREILKCVRLSREGIDEEKISSLFALKIPFGSEILDYMIVVFTNEDALEDDGDTDTLEEYLKDCPGFNEILELCNARKVFFGNKAKAPESQKARQAQELL